MKMRWTTLLLVMLFAWMATGGTFTCTNTDDPPKQQPRAK
ncbi:hypothetical protein BH09PLA1_BH09PLA1_04040 [soil metagenome]